VKQNLRKPEIRKAVDDFCEQARWTPAEHASIGLTDATDALLANRDELAALLARFPVDCELSADLRRIHQRAAAAAAQAERRIEWTYLVETET